MKKVIAFICTVCLIFSVMAPLSAVSVSAAANPWDGWVLSGEAQVEDGILVVSGENGTAKLSDDNLPDSYTLTFTMRVNQVSNSMGLQIRNGVSRAGFYFNSGNSFRSMDNVDGVWTTGKIPNMEDWVDYRLEIDHQNKIQKIYADEVFIADVPLVSYPSAKYFEFWNTYAGGSFEVCDWKLEKSGESGAANEELKRTEEYTEPFFQDFYEIDGWRIEQEPIAIHYPEEGLVRLQEYREHGIYRSVERPLTSTRNYDMEFRVKLEELPAGENQAEAWFSLSDANGHTWLNFNEEQIMAYTKNGETSAYMNVGYDWHVWRAEVRSGFITWYMDGQEVMNYELSYALSWNAVAIWLTGHSAQSANILIDWVRYTPYFEDKLSLTSPLLGSEFEEGYSIPLESKVGIEAEKVDYYINGVYVGSGLKKDNYTYSLEGMRPGTYTLKARLGEIESVESKFTVKQGLKGKLNADKTEINFGEELIVRADAARNDAVRVEFFLDGQLYSEDSSAPFETVLKDLKVGNNSVTAKLYNSNGNYFECEPMGISVKYVEGKPLKIGREYQIDYKLTADSGRITLNDGYFRLNLNHDGNRITYATPEGEKVYEGIGKGDYRIVATAGNAEVYYNGQFAFSMFMPYEPKTASIEKINLEGFSIKSSGVKNTIYAAEIKGQKEFVARDFNPGQFYSIEFDKNDKSPETLIFNDGIFENKLYFREDGLYAQRMFTNAKGTAEEIKLLDEVKTGYYRITVAFGIATVTLDNKPVAHYRCYKYTNGVKLQRNVTNPDATTFVAIKNTDDVYYYNETFEETTELSYADYWSAHPETYRDGYKVNLTAVRKENKGNHYMEISGTGSYLLSAIERRPVFRWRGMVEDREGTVYTVFRRSVNDYYSKLSYDFDSNQWIFEMIDLYGKVQSKTVKYDAEAYRAGQWYNFELVTEGFDVVLLCDGKEVFKATIDYDPYGLYYGRMGFGTIGATYNFDDVEYAGKNRATAGMYFSMGGRFGQDVTNTAALFYNDEEGNIYASSFLNSLKSTDGGKTWSDMVLSTDNDKKGRLLEEQMVRMPNGKLAQLSKFLYGATSGPIYVQFSEDNGKTWGEEYFVTDGYGGIGAVSRLTCTMDGVLYIVTSDGDEYDNTEYIFRSEDEGKTWTLSTPAMSSHETGVIVNEGTVVDTPRENEIWYYTRSQTGFIEYFVSHDNGKTFDLTPHHSGLIAPQCCYRIERDWNNPNTYYASFVYEAEPLSERNTQAPRLRGALAVSYDGMETWEYVADTLEANDNSGSWQTSDDIINIIGDKLLWRFSSMISTSSPDRGPGGTNFGVMELDKVKPLKRMPQVHERAFMGYNILTDGGQYHCVLPKTSGSAWIFGQLNDASVKDGRVDLTTCEKVFGVKASKNGNVVTLTMGDGKIQFAEGAADVNVNGETKKTEEVGLQGGYLSLKVLCEIYGKILVESDDAFAVMTGSVFSEKFQTQLMNVVSTK